ncbi:MAG: oxidoreductase [Gemmataceae bacterium]|nr:oxidoreductase [Gemmataceae bacterium]
MTASEIPWVELAISLPLIGAVVTGRIRDPRRAFQAGVAFTGLTLALSIAAMIVFFTGTPYYSLQERLLGSAMFRLDELNAPLLPLVALLHFLTCVATPRSKMRRFSVGWSLTSESIRLAIFACQYPPLLLALLVLCVLPPVMELRNRREPVRAYAIHMALFVVLLIGGGAGLQLSGKGAFAGWASAAMMLAILLRCGMAPTHTWLIDWLERASFGNAILFVTPLTGMYAAVRLVLPVAPDWVLNTIGLASLVTTVYAAGMALIQNDARRFFAYFFLSQASIVLIGLELHTPAALAGSLSMWISSSLSLTGFGLTLRALEARIGRVDLTRFHGLYRRTPSLAIAFMITGLACVGFPGTLGFVAAELIVDGAVVADPVVGLGVVLATALNGMAVVRVYLLLFTGADEPSTLSLIMGPRERFAILTVLALVIGGGLYPMPGVASRDRVARTILAERAVTVPGAAVPAAGH